MSDIDTFIEEYPAPVFRFGLINEKPATAPFKGAGWITLGSSSQVMEIAIGGDDLQWHTIYEGDEEGSGVTDHGELTGLDDDDHQNYPYMPGRAGGQTIYGGTEAGDDLHLRSTAHATKGGIILDDLVDNGTLLTSGSGGYLTTRKETQQVADTPGSGDDIGDGYRIFSLWQRQGSGTKSLYMARYVASGAAEWPRIDYEGDYTPADGDDWDNPDPTDVDGGLDQLASRVTTLEAAGGLPTGAISMYGGDSAPTGYLLCDGTAVSRTTYDDLFDVIGETYGAGDGSTTFNVPDLQSRFPIGAGTGSGLSTYALGDTGGEESHQLTIDEMPAHDHEIVRSQVDGTFNSTMRSGGAQSGSYTVSSAGDDDPHENRPPFLALNFIIKT